MEHASLHGLPIEVLDRARPIDIEWRRLPHWSQDGTIAFITWRTADSIPAPLLRDWLEQRAGFLRRHHIDPASPDWMVNLAALEMAVQRSFHQTFSDKWHGMLDDCHGERLLARPAVAKIIADSLHHFDNDRYLLTDFVVMPTHVHLLAAFAAGEHMLSQCDSWKHYMAVQINRLVKRKGRFWQQDGFDHLVRSPEQFEYFRRYISENAERAHLRDGEYLHYARKM